MKTRRLAIAALLGSACLTVGCYESRVRQVEVLPDGALVPLDGSVEDGGGMDAATPTSDGGSAPMADAGSPACGDVVAPYEGVGCSAATRACIAACPMTDPTCPDECIAREAECSVCVNQTFVSCANALGCQDAWDAYACCAREETRCASLEGLALLACAEGCDAELLQYDACFRTVDAGACTAQAITTCRLAM
ncbi:MAG: hypothetical protein M3Y87_01760 [Myxococcota bacterium]|nr:hypothetical protein [Myxococcota bacterium]